MESKTLRMGAPGFQRSDAIAIVTLISLVCATFCSAQEHGPPDHEGRSDTLVIRNAIVVDGTGSPAEGGMTIVIEKNQITHLYSEASSSRPGFQKPDLNGDVREIDATGKYVLPGFINMHAHIHGEHPSLTDLDNGNLKMTIDFRRVYATILNEWMGFEKTDEILKGKYPPLGVFA